jgi:asparagine N-glycosylation enzyme membrane subunit Stt3
MEIFFVYGLVFLFFLLTLLFVMVVLPAYIEAPSLRRGIRHESAREQFTAIDKKVVYGTLAVVFIGLLIITVLSEKKSH